MSTERVNNGGGEIPEQGNVYTGPTALQIGNGNQQHNYYDQRTYHGAAPTDRKSVV